MVLHICNFGHYFFVIVTFSKYFYWQEELGNLLILDLKLLLTGNFISKNIIVMSEMQSPSILWLKI